MPAHPAPDAPAHPDARVDFLARASAILGGSLDSDALLEALSAVALPLLGDACVIDLLRDGQHVRRIGAVADDGGFRARVEAFVAVSRPLEQGWMLRQLLDTRRPRLVRRVGDAFLARLAALEPRAAEVVRAAGVRSVMQVPMVVRGEIIGALMFVTRRRSFSRADVELALDLATRAAAALRNAELYGALQRELAERRRMEAQLVEAQKMEAVALLAGGIAHDFNNILTVITGFAEMALHDCAPESPLRNDLAEIKRAADKATTLTRQLLAFSRREPAAPRPVALNDAVAQAQRMLHRILGDEIALEVATSAERPVVHIDPGQLDQVLLNLVVNARDAMPTGGRLTIASTVETRAGSAWAGLVVRDTGTGMSDEVRRRIFEPFYTSKAPGQGTGLGLATVFTIVKAAGGTIDVQSSPGAGSTFTIWLPLPPAHEAPIASASAGGGGGGETVLLATADPYARRLARRALDDRGYQVLEAGSGDEALALAGEDGAPRVHLLVADEALPDVAGEVLAASLAPGHAGMRALLLTDGPADAGPAGAVPTLPRGVEGARLALAVRAVLDGRLS